MTFLALDQGTTSSRAILFDTHLKVLAMAQQEFPQHFPAPGWVEQEPEDLWSSTLATIRQALSGAGDPQITAIGIANQRETTLLWDRKTGQALHRAIVWQDRRTAPLCEKLRAAGHEPMIRQRTGLLLDPYFSGTKLAWLLDTIPNARARAEAGELAFGTVDSWLLWKLTKGASHATDATNASRTMLYDISKGAWDPEICALLNIPLSLLPKVQDSASEFGLSDPALFGQAVPIRGIAGDQQAATIGQACFAPGMMKATYGTGCFALLNTGDQMVISSHRLLTTIAYQLDGKPHYALEGSIFIAGAVVQWMRDALGIIATSGETEELAKAADPAQNVTIVPAFTGLGAPYWRPECQGAIFGMTRNTGPAELARAALESVGLQTLDLWQAMCADYPVEQAVLRVDGGMSQNNWAMQFLSDMLEAPVDRPTLTETTALGVAWLAGYQSGLVPAPQGFSESWTCQHRFTPQMPAQTRQKITHRWQRAINAALAF